MDRRAYPAPRVFRGASRALLACVLAAAAVMLASPALTWADEDAPIELAWRLRPGQTLTYRVVTDQRATQTVDGRPYETRQRVEMVMTLAVQDKDPDGRARLTCRYDRVAIDLEQMLLGRVMWDSDKAEDGPRASEPSIRPFATLVRRSFSFALLPDGSVPEDGLEGFDKIREAVLAPLADQPLVLAAYAPAFSDGAIRALLERSWRVLPDTPVSPGARWERTVTQPVPLLGLLRYQTAYRLASLEGDGEERLARVGFDVTLSSAAAPAPTRADSEPSPSATTPANPSAAIEVTFEGGSGAGEALFRVEDGWLVKSVQDVRMTLTTRIAEPHAPAEGPGARRARSEVRQRMTVERMR